MTKTSYFFLLGATTISRIPSLLPEWTHTAFVSQYCCSLELSVSISEDVERREEIEEEK